MAQAAGIRAGVVKNANIACDIDDPLDLCRAIHELPPTFTRRFLEDSGIAARLAFRGNIFTERDRWLCNEVGPTLRDKGVLFAGLDVIGDYLTEINVTSPTGIRELDRQYDIEVAAMLLEAIDRKLTDL